MGCFVASLVTTITRYLIERPAVARLDLEPWARLSRHFGYRVGRAGNDILRLLYLQAETLPRCTVQGTEEETEKLSQAGFVIWEKVRYR